MTSVQEEYPNELLKKMKKWGIVRGQDEIEDILLLPKGTTIDSDFIDFANYPLNWQLSQHVMSQKFVEEVSLRKRVKLLEAHCKMISKKLQEIEKWQEIRKKPTESEQIYAEQKNELEKEYFGKIVAIDNTTKKIVGIGNTIIEAYYDAKKNTSKDKFSYIRVGYTDRL